MYYGQVTDVNTAFCVFLMFFRLTLSSSFEYSFIISLMVYHKRSFTGLVMAVKSIPFLLLIILSRWLYIIYI